MEETDVVLLIGGQYFNCHRSVLKKASPYFDAMFNSEMMEKLAKEVEIHDAEPEIFQILIDFAYQKNISINSENVISLLKTSNIFQFDEIEKMCCEYLSRKLDVSNCVTVFILADFLNVKSLYIDAKTFIVREFSSIYKENDFFKLPIKLFIELLSCNFLNCEDEFEVFESITNWISHNQSKEMIDLLQCIRFRSLSQDDFEKIKNHPLIQNNMEARTFMNIASNIMNKDQFTNENYETYHDFDKFHEKAVVAVENQPRKSILPLIVGRRSKPFMYAEYNLWANNKFERKQREINKMPCLLLWTGNKFEELEHPYCVNNKCFKSQKHFYNNNVPVYGYVTCIIGNDLYLFGGEHVIGSGHWNKMIWKCNLQNNEWNNVGALENPRRHCLIAVLDEEVYFIGGYGKFRKKLTTVESYNIRTGIWQEKAQIPIPVHSSVAVAYDDNIYVFSTPIYCYIPSKNEWKEALPWKEIGFSSAFVFKDNLYAITRQDPAILLHFTLPEFQFQKEFVFPSHVNCGSLSHNIFYGFNENTVMMYDMTKKICETKPLDGVLYTEMSCSIPNFKNIN